MLLLAKLSEQYSTNITLRQFSPPSVVFEQMDFLDMDNQQIPVVNQQRKLSYIGNIRMCCTHWALTIPPNIKRNKCFIFNILAMMTKIR
jgi:hypothetical protein